MRFRTADPASQALRFLVVGGINTLTTAIIYLFTSSIVPTGIAFSLAFASGVAIAVVVTPRLVFRARATSGQRVAYAALYSSLYLTGLVMVLVLREMMLLDNVIVALATSITTAVLGFMGGRRLFAKVPGGTGSVIG